MGWHKINSYFKLSPNPHPQWHIWKQKKSGPWHKKAINREGTQGEISGSIPREWSGDRWHHLHHGHNCFLLQTCAGSQIFMGPHVGLWVLWRSCLLLTFSYSLLHWTPALCFLMYHRKASKLHQPINMMVKTGMLERYMVIVMPLLRLYSPISSMMKPNSLTLIAVAAALSLLSNILLSMRVSFPFLLIIVLMVEDNVVPE